MISVTLPSKKEQFNYFTKFYSFLGCVYFSFWLQRIGLRAHNIVMLVNKALVTERFLLGDYCGLFSLSRCAGIRG